MTQIKPRRPERTKLGSLQETQADSTSITSVFFRSPSPQEEATIVAPGWLGVPLAILCFGKFGVGGLVRPQVRFVKYGQADGSKATLVTDFPLIANTEVSARAREMALGSKEITPLGLGQRVRAEDGIAFIGLGYSSGDNDEEPKLGTAFVKKKVTIRASDNVPSGNE